MKFKPHDYQAYAIDYILRHPIAAAILDMGLGKTVITLTAIDRLLHDSFEIRKVLVIAPHWWRGRHGPGPWSARPRRARD